MNDLRVFQTGRSRGVDPVQLARLVERAETIQDCHDVASLLEQGNANAGAVRFLLGQRLSEAWAQVEAFREGAPLEETPQPGRAKSGVSSSGAEPASFLSLESGLRPAEGLTEPSHEDGPNAPLTYESWLEHITRVYDDLLRAIGLPEPQSLKAPPLRRVK